MNDPAAIRHTIRRTARPFDEADTTSNAAGPVYDQGARFLSD